MIELEFKRQQRLKGIERGYYFKGELLSKLKTEAINILRKKVEEAGQGNWEKGKEILPDDANILNEEWQKSNDRTKKIEEKKKPYYEQMHINSLKHQILTLQIKLENAILKKRQVEEIYQAKIFTLNEEKDKIQQIINKHEAETDGKK
jgi:hypothetical protein